MVLAPRHRFGPLTINQGAVAEFTQTHGFGADASGRSVTINGGTLQFDYENYVSGLSLTGGSVIGPGELRTPGAVSYTVNAAATPSLISVGLNLLAGALTLNVAKGPGGVDLLVSGNAYGSYGLTKSGAGLMRYTGMATNNGSTTINGGTLQVDGSLGTNTLTVLNTAILAGVGSLNGATTIQSGGTLAPGAGGIGTLTFGKNLNLAGKTVMEISKLGALLTNDLAAVSGTLTYGGSLVVTNLGGTFVAGDKFTLFNAQARVGVFASLSLPTPGAGLGWTNLLAVDGSIQVVPTVNTATTNISAVISGGNLNLSWPVDHTGWRLLVQTNNLSLGVSSNANDWGTVSGSAATNQVAVPLDVTKATEFYRLVYP